MAEDSDLEKTEAATDKRIERAREDGKVAQSRELSTFIELMAAVLVMMALGSFFSEKLMAMMRNSFAFDRAAAFDPSLMWTRLSQESTQIMLALLPLFGISIIAALAGPLLMSGWNLSWKALSPNFSKFNPISGIKRIFSVNGLVELVKSLLKVILLGGIAAWVIWGFRDDMFALISEPLESSVSHFTNLLLSTALFLVSAMLLIVAIDVPFQHWNYGKNLRMTKEEVKREAKESEGDPQIKARIRSAQRDAARKRMMSAVPKADVIVTNPTHYAVALKYDQRKMGAPQIVAKGGGLLAARIIELGRENKVPFLEAPPLARALYHHADIGDEVPQRLYTAVAEVLAYVYQLRQPAAGITPKPPRNLPVPEDMDIPETERV